MGTISQCTILPPKEGMNGTLFGLGRKKHYMLRSLSVATERATKTPCKQMARHCTHFPQVTRAELLLGVLKYTHPCR